MLRSRLSGLTAALSLALLGILALPQPSVAISVDEVLALLDAGVGENVILDQMAADGSVYRLSTNDILDLKDAGASDELISAMIATADGRGAPRGSYGDYYGERYDYHGSRRYYVSIYYDPFGYYWYPSPFYFSYVAPFTYFDFGFYYGAPVYWNWACWGPRYHYYAYTAGYYWKPYRHDHAYHGSHRDGRRVWSRTHTSQRNHYLVSSKTPRSSSLASVSGRTVSRSGSRWSRARGPAPATRRYTPARSARPGRPLIRSDRGTRRPARAPREVTRPRTSPRAPARSSVSRSSPPSRPRSVARPAPKSSSRSSGKPSSRPSRGARR